MRPDKGLDLLPKILRHVGDRERHVTTLIVSGRGVVPSTLRDEVGALGVKYEDRTSTAFLRDEEIREALGGADVLLAPYVGATQSSTVVAALTLGVPVLAFDVGAIGEVVTDSGLVAAGDTRAMADRLTLAVRGLSPLGRSQTDPRQWRELCRDEWLSALGLVADAHA